MPKPEKSEFVKIDRGGYFLSITVSGYHIITISKSFSRSKTPNSGFRLSGYPAARASGQNMGLENITNRKHLKSPYTKPPKIIRLLLILHEQFNFYVPQHGRALVPSGLRGGGVKSDTKVGFLVPKLVYSPILRSIRPQLFEKLLIQINC